MRIGFDLARRAIANPPVDQNRLRKVLLRLVTAQSPNRPKNVVWQDVGLGVAPPPGVPTTCKGLEVSLGQYGCPHDWDRPCHRVGRCRPCSASMTTMSSASRK